MLGELIIVVADFDSVRDGHVLPAFFAQHLHLLGYRVLNISEVFKELVFRVLFFNGTLDDGVDSDFEIEDISITSRLEHLDLGVLLAAVEEEFMLAIGRASENEFLVVGEGGHFDGVEAVLLHQASAER